MKTELQGIGEFDTHDWRKILQPFVSIDGGLKIGNYRQLYPLHYVVKDFLTDEIISQYEQQVK